MTISERRVSRMAVVNGPKSETSKEIAADTYLIKSTDQLRDLIHCAVPIGALVDAVWFYIHEFLMPGKVASTSTPNLIQSEITYIPVLPNSIPPLTKLSVKCSKYEHTSDPLQDGSPCYRCARANHSRVYCKMAPACML